jgi:acid stress-induced BolA-like protein IbaG/YrbA
MEEQEIIDKIRELYPEASIEASGENCNFEVFVVDSTFEGMSLLKRQQSILNLFSEELKTGKLHALGVKAKTPEQLTDSPNNLVQIS